MEQIIFLILPIVFSIFSLYMKSKKQRAQTLEAEKISPDFEPQNTPFLTQELDTIFEAYNVAKLSQNGNYLKKNTQNTPKRKKTETVDIVPKNPANDLHNIDLENDIELLQDFEGTEIQKAFLYSEIFKYAKN